MVKLEEEAEKGDTSSYVIVNIGSYKLFPATRLAVFVCNKHNINRYSETSS